MSHRIITAANSANNIVNQNVKTKKNALPFLKVVSRYTRINTYTLEIRNLLSYLLSYSVRYMFHPLNIQQCLQFIGKESY